MGTTLRILASRSLLSARLPRQRTSEQMGKMISASYATTVHQPQVDHHTRLADVWWDTAGRMRALHAMNHLRVQLIIDGLANPKVRSQKPFSSLDGIKIMEVGCGGGVLSEGLAKAGADMTSIDASEELIQLAKTHADTDPRVAGKINYMRALIEEFAPANEGAFDAVVASEVLEHVSNHKLFVENCVRAVKPGGSIFFTTPNRTFTSYIGGYIIAEKILSLIPKGTHHWHNFISLEETQRLLHACDCKTKLTLGMMYNPMTNMWFWTKSTKIAYAIHAVKSTKQW